MESSKGIFAKSATGKFLERNGAMPYVSVAWAKTAGPVARAVLYAEESVPPCWNRYTEVVKPYIKFGVESARVAWAFTVRTAGVTCDCYHQKAPIVAAFVSVLCCLACGEFDSNRYACLFFTQIEQYAPGLPQKFGDASALLWANLRNTSIQCYTSGEEFFRTKVFVYVLCTDAQQ